MVSPQALRAAKGVMQLGLGGNTLGADVCADLGTDSGKLALEFAVAVKLAEARPTWFLL